VSFDIICLEDALAKAIASSWTKLLTRADIDINFPIFGPGVEADVALCDDHEPDIPASRGFECFDYHRDGQG